jgi:hypothetical protein
MHLIACYGLRARKIWTDILFLRVERAESWSGYWGCSLQRLGLGSHHGSSKGCVSFGHGRKVSGHWQIKPIHSQL